MLFCQINILILIRYDYHDIQYIATAELHCFQLPGLTWLWIALLHLSCITDLVLRRTVVAYGVCQIYVKAEQIMTRGYSVEHRS